VRSEATPGRWSRYESRSAAELDARLRGLSLRGLDAHAVTGQITGEVLSWARDRGWAALTEVAFGFLRNTHEYPDRHGRLDVFIRRPDQETDLVVEIDRANKQWSATKLKYAIVDGKSAIWIRWGGKAPSRVDCRPEVEIIFLPVSNRRRPRPVFRFVPFPD
jgi:hypothetical protein